MKLDDEYTEDQLSKKGYSLVDNVGVCEVWENKSEDKRIFVQFKTRKVLYVTNAVKEVQR